MLTIDTKTKILKESIILFSNYGYEGTSLSLIAKRIGITKPSIYAHYKSKQEIFEACLEEVTNKQLEFVMNVLSDDSTKTCKQKLFSLIKNCSEKVEDNYYSFYYRFLYFPSEEIKELAQNKIIETAQMSNELIFEIIEKGIKNREIRCDLTSQQVLSSYSCVLDGLSCNVNALKHLDDIWLIFWNGIKI